MKTVRYLFIVFQLALFFSFCADAIVMPSATDSLAPPAPPYTELFYDQDIDHFKFGTDLGQFKQRYLLNNESWKGDGPVFFYTGNEGEIETFWKNSGLVHELAVEFGALVVFMEHRYYGQSFPVHGSPLPGQMDFSFLSVEQALADFACFITDMRKNEWLKASAVISFGGSYGGMLSSWLRVRYPWIVNGAIAASAPIGSFFGIVDEYRYNEIVTNDYVNAGGKECVNVVRRGFAAINELIREKGGRELLKNAFHLCSDIKESEGGLLGGFIETALSFMAMLDYPYPTDFLTYLPANPVAVACSKIIESNVHSNDWKDNAIKGMYRGINVYYNSTGEAKCFNMSTSADARLGYVQWNYQECTEMVFPTGSNNVTDFYTPSKWSFTDILKLCESKWAVKPRENWSVLSFGGFGLESASNIVFSNGDKDPWSSGGLLHSVSESVIAVTFDGGHHLDLRFANSKDPESVIKARMIEKDHIAEWIKESERSRV